LCIPLRTVQGKHPKGMLHDIGPDAHDPVSACFGCPLAARLAAGHVVHVVFRAIPAYPGDAS